MEQQYQQKNYKSITKNKFFVPALIVALLVLGSIFFALTRTDNETIAVGEENSRISIAKPKATQNLSKTYEFPLKDSAGKEVSKLKFVVENAELRDEVIVKGKRAISVEGRTFLILNAKITNSYNRTIAVNARDYVRLTVNKSSEKSAADIHNDPVEILADSTKATRLGFPINDTDKNLTLIIGELNGKKDTIVLNLK